MSINAVNRRNFLTLGLGLIFGSSFLPSRLFAEPVARRAPFSADVGILYQLMTFHLEGDIQESIDRSAGRYDVRINGAGDSIANRIESTGVLRAGRWTPLQGSAWFQVRGRESRTQITYDHDRKIIDYHAKAETFFLRRLRVVDDTLPLRTDVTMDDAVSALLNYRDGYWKPGPDGKLHTNIVRRRLNEGEGPDDVAQTYRAELAPLDLKIEPDPETRRPSALLDLSRFSSWARENRPARIVFDDERRPALITGSMILGTSLTIRLA